jgi:hypothetical protein
MTNKCYRYEKILYKDGLFNKSIDATYIINLEGNGRLDYIMKQLEEYHPTNIVYIVFNKGFKKCKKADFIINPPYDLVDANLNIFKHAKDNNYDNILILEDDFIFNSEIKSDFHINNINNFLEKKKNKLFQYYIGCVPYLMIPYDNYNYIQKSTGTHSTVFSKNLREDLLNTDQMKITDWDTYNNYNYVNRYAYYKPLCYQLFPETENSKYWGKNGSFRIPMIFMGNAIKKVFIYFKMNEQPEPGFYIFYLFSKIIFHILILLLIIIIYKMKKNLSYNE